MKMITRYNAPTKYDRCEAGVICKTLKDIDIPTWDTHEPEPKMTNDECFDLYIQVGRNKENPKWLPIGDFFQKIFGNAIYEADLTEEFMKLYANDNYNSFLALSKLLKKKVR